MYKSSIITVLSQAARLVKYFTLYVRTYNKYRVVFYYTIELL